MIFRGNTVTFKKVDKLTRLKLTSFWITVTLALIGFGTAVTLITSSAAAKDCPSALVNGVPCIGTPKFNPIPEHPPFENEIMRLLQVATHDLITSLWGTTKIDMEARKRFFSDEGWEQYQDYVTWHKKILKGMEEDEKRPWHVIASLTEGSQKYTSLTNGLAEFSARGHFLYSYADDYTIKKPQFFKIEVLFSVDKKNPPDFLIHQWDGGLEPEVNGVSNGLPR